jgi:hypothetical protein
VIDRLIAYNVDMSANVYVVLGLIALIVLGIGRVVRWWNLPSVVQARASRAIERQKQRTERVRLRRGSRLFGRRRLSSSDKPPDAEDH